MNTHITYTTIPYAPSPMYAKLVYLGPTSNICPLTSSVLGPGAAPVVAIFKHLWEPVSAM